MERPSLLDDHQHRLTSAFVAFTEKSSKRQCREDLRSLRHCPIGKAPKHGKGGMSYKSAKKTARRKQERLLWLYHTAGCQKIECHCGNGKELWNHMEKCNVDVCVVKHCHSSRSLLSHFARCKNDHCLVCPGVRRAIRRYGSTQNTKRHHQPNAGIRYGGGHLLDRIPEALAEKHSAVPLMQATPPKQKAKENKELLHHKTIPTTIMPQVQIKGTKKEAAGVPPTKLSTITEETIPKEFDRQGQSCGGCLCDMRRAIVIISCVGILAHIFSVASYKFWIIDPAVEDLEEIPSQREEVDRLEQLFLIHASVSLIGITGYLMAIGGGLYFQQWPVRINVAILWIVYIVNAVLFFQAIGDIDELNVSGAIVLGTTMATIMTVYIHVSFSREVVLRTMTQQKHVHEQQSCCCV